MEVMDLIDSDETHFSPDLEKDPEEIRNFYQCGEEHDLYYERTCKFPPGECRDQLPDSDETFFEPAENGLLEDQTTFNPNQSMPRPYQPEAGGTYFEPAENVLSRSENRCVRPMGGYGALPSAVSQEPIDPDETFFEVSDGEYIVDDVLAAVRECPEDFGQCTVQQSKTSSIFTHCPEWSERSGQDKESRDGKACCANLVPQSQDDLYIQIRDEVNQEMHFYKVSGTQDETSNPCWAQRVQQAPDASKLFTQDLEWTQTQQAPDASKLFTQDLEWTQTQQAPDASKLFTQDLEWTQTQQVQATPQDHAMDENPGADARGSGWCQPVAQERTSSGDHSMDTGSSATTGAAAQQVPEMKFHSSSSLESEARAGPSLPSFEDDDLPLTLPCWPLLLEDQINIEEIVASLSNISFNLDAVQAIEDAVVPKGVEQPPLPSNDPEKQALSSLPEPLPIAAPVPTPPRSPTFSHHSHRRFRRARAKRETLRVAQESDRRMNPDTMQQGACSGSQAPCSNLNIIHSPIKRKRTLNNHRRTLSAVPTFSPPSPPRQRARKSCPSLSKEPTSHSKERPEMTNAFLRLQELRFFMQDILGGRQTLPDFGNVERMHQEVLAILSTLKQVPKIEGGQNAKSKQKMEEAQQVADKLLHQLSVLLESQEICDTTEQSWNNTESSQIKEREKSQSDFQKEKICSFPVCNEDEILSNQRGCFKSKRLKSKEKNSSKKTSGSCHLQETLEKVSLTEHSNRKGSGMNRGVDSTSSMFSENPSEEKVLDLENNVCLVNADVSFPSSADKLKFSNPQPGLSMDTAPAVVPHSEGIFQDVNSLEPVIDNVLINSSLLPQNDVSSIVEHQSSLHKNRINTTSLQTEPHISAEYENAAVLAVNDFNLEETDTANDWNDDEEDCAKREEYLKLVKVIKAKCSTPKTEDFVWQGGSLKLTGILLPKTAEMTPIDDLPPDFWGNPNAPIPADWISILDWDD